jgi:heterodisulfide reductase subunit C
MIFQFLFLVLLIAAAGLFTKNISKIRRNILLGRDLDLSDHKGLRWKNLLTIAMGQSKMAAKPIPFLLHLCVYVGFIIINIELIEIVIDGLVGTHRVFAPMMGSLYNFLIASFEWLAFLVLLACVVFISRRNLIKLKRFTGTEMTKWPKSDANYILVIEILLMLAFLTMNAADAKLQFLNVEHYLKAGSFPVSAFLQNILPNDVASLIAIERTCWWFHIIGIFAFLNYVPYSKHLHILFAFPASYYGSLNAKGKINNMQSVSNEVKAMLDPSFVPVQTENPGRFGAKDATDLNWKNLLDSYACTECGRCTSMCPANQTGKLLSPRKIMMDTRDRLEEVGRNIDKNKGVFIPDNVSLLNDYITTEELWACTSCNACVEECPVNISPLSIIIDMRRYLVMEQSAAPQSLNAMMSNIENNGAPWQYNQMDRLNWKEE